MAAGALTLLELGIVKVLGAVPDGMHVATGYADSNSSPLSVIEAQAKVTPTALADSMGEVLSEVAVMLAVSRQFGLDVGLLIAIPMITALYKSHRHITL